MSCYDLIIRLSSFPSRSHAFIPYDADDHTGVVFPTGLQLIRDRGTSSGKRPSLLLGYGKGDDRVMMMTLSHEAVQEYLMPVSGVDARQYKFCTIGNAGTPILYTHSPGD